MRQRVPMIVALGATFLAGCLQKVDSGASAGMGMRDPNAPLTTQIDPAEPPIQVDPEDETAVVTDPCEKTTRDKTAILTAYCAKCHDGPSALGLPKFDMILNDQALITQEWMRQGQPPQRFVVPGDPMRSVIYTRMAIAADMPPIPSDVGTTRDPVPTLSDIDIIRQWITYCAGPAEPKPASTGGTTGATGSGGSTGAGTGTGGSSPTSTGGQSGTPPATGGAAAPPPPPAGNGGASGGGADAGTPAADGGAPLNACAANVNNGTNCAANNPPCRLNAMTCTCVAAGGARRWMCQ